MSDIKQHREAGGTPVIHTRETQAGITHAAYGKGSLNHQVAIVTGAATGIGAGVVQELAARGAAVIINHLHQEEEAQELVGQITDKDGKAVTFSADVSQADDVAKLVNHAVSSFGRLDIMIANAGIQVDAAALDMSPQQWDKAMQVDLRGAFLCAQAAARQFIKQGVDETISRAAGKIICMLSVHDHIPWAGHVNYAAAKGGEAMMVRTLAQEWADRRIRVTGIAPGAIKTAINKSVWERQQTRDALLRLIPYRRMGDVEDVARAAAWLVSDEADYITGSTIYVDGGMMLYPGFRDNG